MSFPQMLIGGYLALTSSIFYKVRNDSKQFPDLKDLQKIYDDANATNQPTPSNITNALKKYENMSLAPTYPTAKNYKSLTSLIQDRLSTTDCNEFSQEEKKRCQHLKNQLEQIRINRNTNSSYIFGR